MKIGIISDTHDRLDMVRRACQMLREAGAQTVLHAGDYVAPFVIPEFDKGGMSLIGVFGNNDGEKLFLSQKFRELRFEVFHGPYEFEIEGRKVCLMHEPRCLDSLARSGSYDLIVYGHTHQIDIQEEGTLVINPGEACGYLTGKATCALVDLGDLSGRIIELEAKAEDGSVGR